MEASSCFWNVSFDFGQDVCLPFVQSDDFVEVVAASTLKGVKTKRKINKEEAQCIKERI